MSLPAPQPRVPSCALGCDSGPFLDTLPGAIVKRLPRKLDVMEGENAAFCVETRDAVEGICWSRNGLELRETPCTVLKSFGKTHLLVLVHVTREDAGVISFSVGESQTSAQLRVKCESPPGGWHFSGAWSPLVCGSGSPCSRAGLEPASPRGERPSTPLGTSGLFAFLCSLGCGSPAGIIWAPLPNQAPATAGLGLLAAPRSLLFAACGHSSVS